ncbi:MAG: S8 family serine peptidase [Melioribacteraceae bacterium]|nr:S8 family serine peptidase [Melioribacteraceae bacterium]
MVPPGTALESISVGSFDSKESWYSDSTGYVQTTRCPSGSKFHRSRVSVQHVDGRVKPEIAAPGSFVASAFSSARQTGNYNLLVNGGGYYMMRGTSMAAPVVTGSVAFIIRAESKL